MGRGFLASFIALLAASPACGAPPTLGWIFQDSMVMQRNLPLPVWGAAAPGAEIMVEFAGQTKQATAADDGTWRVTFDAVAANATPQNLRVTAGGEITVVRDILVGDVWVAAGQSNMEWPLASEAHAAAELPKADRPQIRLLNLPYAGRGYFAKPFDSAVLERLTADKFFRGSWKRCNPQSAASFSAVAYYFARDVQENTQLPLGVIHLAVGGSPAEAWIRREAMASDEGLRAIITGDWLANENLDAWCRQRGRENLASLLAQESRSPDAAGPNHPFKPGFLWDVGIARLIPFPIRGVVWYQGESNSLTLSRVRQHERLFPLLVADWRAQWDIGDFPFLYCQISSISSDKGYKSQFWPEFRDGQRRMLHSIPNVGMAVTSDVGHPTDVHPRNKKDVGHRLALWALARVYQQDIPYCGPLAASAHRERDSVVVRFDHADGGLQTADGRPPRGFEIADNDGVYVAAEVSLGDATARLHSHHVRAPTSVRYGWQPFSQGNLTNGASLPASTFQLAVEPGAEPK